MKYLILTFLFTSFSVTANAIPKSVSETITVVATDGSVFKCTRLHNTMVCHKVDTSPSTSSKYKRTQS